MKPFHNNYFRLILSGYLALFLFVLPVSGLAGHSRPGQQPSPDGRYVARYANGKPKERGFYLNGIKSKVWYYYDERGVIIKKERWKDGAVLWQILYENGHVVKTIDKDGNVKERPACGC